MECSSLKSVTFAADADGNSDLEFVEENAFENCLAITDVYVKAHARTKDETTYPVCQKRCGRHL